MMKKENLLLQFGLAMEEVAKVEYEAYFEGNWNHFRLGYAFGTLITYGKALGMSYTEAREIEQQQTDMVLLGQ